MKAGQFTQRTHHRRMTENNLESVGDVLPDHPSRHLISICIPVYNEQQNIPHLLERLRGVAQNLAANYDFEFLFTDDGSVDRTYELLVQEAQEDHRIRVLRLSRNFGFQRNVLVNFLNARGDAALEIDADLQDPPGTNRRLSGAVGEGLQGRLWRARRAQRRPRDHMAAKSRVPDNQ
jgi:glycosyltransferase involved in cell wall biosynthesis